MSNFTEFGIFLSLLDGKIHKATDLAQSLEVSTKTVYRQAEKLAFSGFPITTTTGKNGGISIAGKFLCDTWFFTEQELAYLLNLISSNHNIDPSLAVIITQKIKKHIQSKDLSVADNLTGKLFIDNMPWFNTASLSIDKFSDILKCCENNYKLNITYYPSTTQRIVDPHCIVYKENNYYLYAWCNNRKQFRLFKINKITSFIVSSSHFVPQEINLQDRPWNNSKFDLIDVYLKCDKPTIMDISTWAKVQKTDCDIYKIKAVNNLGLIHKFMEYGKNITIIKPKKIVENIIKECNNLINIYT